MTAMNDNKCGIIIQARTGSTRLPRKMALPFYEGKGILQLLLERIRAAVPEGTEVVVATTDAAGDDVICDIARDCGCRIFRGSEEDVLSRFIGAAGHYGLDRVLRICADNPFLDMDCMLNILRLLSDGVADYYAYATSAGLPSMKTHYGFWCEGVRVDALRRVAGLTSEKLYHEHVTNYIYAHPEIFSLSFTQIPPQLDSNRRIRLTLDTAEDFAMQQQIYARVMQLGGISTDRVMQVLESDPAYYERMEQQIKSNSK